jgi:uncharacterized membrane protein
VRWLVRWPFLAGAVLAYIGAVILLTENEQGREVAAAALLISGSIMLGAFIVLMAQHHDD